MSIYDYDEEEVRKVLAKEMAEEMVGEMAEKMAEEMAGKMAEEMAGKMAEKYAQEAADKAFAEGGQSMMINQIIKKVKKSKTLETIASELEEEVADIKPVYEAVIAAAPDYDIDIIKNKLAVN